MSSCYCNCDPETTAVTINQTFLEVTNENLVWAHEYFVGSDRVGGTLTLANTPFSDEIVLVFVDGVSQGEDAAGDQHNFSVVDDVVTFHFVPAAGANIHIAYMYPVT